MDVFDYMAHQNQVKGFISESMIGELSQMDSKSLAAGVGDGFRIDIETLGIPSHIGRYLHRVAGAASNFEQSAFELREIFQRQIDPGAKRPDEIDRQCG